ncbi:helix-hairpin-helix domain-containing protein [Metasolibacillus sp.]|uniref:helix-hairpin-helix domain-containing protein n=1 Tax=Metasolibacillus sp. TaxID=2703680 RepID=UPI0025DB0131|nr:helix-hairpin-helix domain-containing protein [Metasolibacillus sp.]MCT6923268.1 helix-hairpin-helix domain-containing protein [Metasolibacillus sp.]MCT6939427.1 helix-hairpin-helix domain-containing protein [Metasolibacillus sp.]
MMQRYFQKYGKGVLFPIALLAGLLYFFLQQSNSTEVDIIPVTEQPSYNENEETTDPVSAVMVDVKGQVKFPGVYELTEEHRIIDAIQMAGGYTEQADTKMINHAQRLQDEMVIYVPFQGEELADSVNIAVPQLNASGKVNINTADETQLMTIPGIGPAKAQAIISYRNEAGKFQTIDDIKKVSGIGEKSFERIKELIEVK